MDFSIFWLVPIALLTALLARESFSSSWKRGTIGRHGMITVCYNNSGRTFIVDSWLTVLLLDDLVVSILHYAYACAILVMTQGVPLVIERCLPWAIVCSSAIIIGQLSKVIDITGNLHCVQVWCNRVCFCAVKVSARGSMPSHSRISTRICRPI